MTKDKLTVYTVQPNDEREEFTVDERMFCDGAHFTSYRFLGSRVCKKGVRFTVWAPHAKAVSVVGDFNDWDEEADPMSSHNGFWSCTVEGISQGTVYKYRIEPQTGKALMKADPYAFYGELRPNTASVVWDVLNFLWSDEGWMTNRTEQYDKPLNIYELHIGSWRTDETGGFLNYSEIADRLIPHLRQYHYTHVEIMPVSEHPFDGSWGYQTTGYYAVTSRYGTPYDFKCFVEKLHLAGFGVITDWVPGHFCKDAHGLYRFDGSYLYECENEKLRENHGWGTANFDFTKKEVHSFLISNAFFWFDIYHVDGIRVDAVSNMLYLNYGKGDDFDIRNKNGGFENIEAIEFLKKLNKAVFERFQNPLMIAEESSAWPLVTKPDYLGGLGFNYKWNMGWMNDMLQYMSLDPYFRKYNHRLITFSFMYAFSENYILPISHDEVVHGKKSLVDKMPGTYEQKFANARLFAAYMMAHPGKKLLFMGSEIAQFTEWDYGKSVEWELLSYPAHDSYASFVRELNALYQSEPAFWELDHSYEGFDWIDHSNYKESLISFLRKSKNAEDFLIFVFNFTPVPHPNYPIGIDRFTDYVEIFNTDAQCYGGGGMTNEGLIEPKAGEYNDRNFHIEIDVPPLGACILKPRFTFCSQR